MRRLLLLLVLAVPSAAAPLLQEAYPNPWTPNEPEEYVTIANPGPVPADLSNWTLSEGEGSITLPPGTVLAPGASLTVARNATAYRAVALAWPDLEIEDAAPEVPNAASNGTLRLANDGDEVVLRDAEGRVRDSVAYGDSPGAPGWAGPPVPRPVQGGLLFRWEGWDTDTAADWHGPRTLRAGQTRLAPETFLLENLSLFTSPESAVAEVAGLLRGARERLVAELYTLHHPHLVRELADAARRGVRVDLLLEASPVGGVPDRSLLGALEAAGVNVTLLETPRYRFLHAKVAVADGREVLLLTENWNPSGLPVDGRGNRGWGLRGANESLAALLEEVHRLDGVLRPGDREGRIDRGSPLPSLASTIPSPGPGLRLPNATALLLLGPDNGLDGVRGLLRSARERLDVLQQTVEPGWGEDASPLVEELLDAARRGVRVRVLHQYGDLRDLRARAAAEGLDLEVRTWVPHGGALSLHAKGVVADDRVLVSSFNWGRNSFSNNREAGLVVENATAAAFFAASFEEDWAAAGPGFPWWSLLLPGALVFFYAWRRARRGR